MARKVTNDEADFQLQRGADARVFVEGERKALVIQSQDGWSFAAQRIVNAHKGPFWSEPLKEFDCFLRGFEPAGSRTQEVLVNRFASNPNELEMEFMWGARCRFDAAESVSTLDLKRDELRTSLRAPRIGRSVSLVYSSPEPEGRWKLDLQKTLAANPEIAPLPLPRVSAVVTVVRVPTRHDSIPKDAWEHLESILAIPGTEVACVVRGDLKPQVSLQLRCDLELSGIPAPTRFQVTGLWGDPNPRLLAVRIAGRGQERYAVVPFETDIWITPLDYLTAPYANAPVTAFLTLHREA